MVIIQELLKSILASSEIDLIDHHIYVFFSYISLCNDPCKYHIYNNNNNNNNIIQLYKITSFYQSFLVGMHAQRPVTHRGNRDRTATDPSHSWVKFRRNGSMMKRKRFLKAGTKIQRVLPMCVGDRILPRLGY